MRDVLLSMSRVSLPPARGKPAAMPTRQGSNVATVGVNFRSLPREMRFTMKEYQSRRHTRSDCKYRVVFVPRVAEVHGTPLLESVSAVDEKCGAASIEWVAQEARSGHAVGACYACLRVWKPRCGLRKRGRRDTVTSITGGQGMNGVAGRDGQRRLFTWSSGHRSIPPKNKRHNIHARHHQAA